MSRSFFPSFFSPLLQARITLALLACVLLALTSSSGYAQQNKAVKPLTPKAQYQQLTTEGNALRVNKQYPEARAKFTEAAALMPTLPAPWEEIGVCYEQEQNPDEAQKAHVKALELDATYKPAVNSLLRFAQTYNSTNRPLEALALLEMLYTKTSGANQLRPAEEFLITLSKMGNYPRIVQETPKVLKLLIEQGKETKAAAVRQAGKTFDAITRAWDATGVLNAKIIESDGLYRGKSVDSPQSVVLSNLLLAAARIEKGKSGTANALDYLTRAIALMPDNIESYREKTDLLQKVKGKDEALVFVKLALEKFPKDEPLLSKEGEYYTQRNEFRPALEVYQKLQELQPQNNWYLRRLIDTQLSLNMQKEAKQTFQKAIDRINADPSSSAESKKQQVEYLRKTFQDKLDLVSLNQDQVQSVQQDLTAHPQDPMAWRRLGDFYLDQSDQQLALSAYLQAAYLAKDPANFISKTFEIVANPRKAEPMPYLIALVEHFPSNTENFRAIQEIINQQRIKPDKRFALTPEQTEGFRIAEKACLLIAKQPDISNDMRLQAQFCAIKYHNE
ncbi:TPA: hypothetical protein DDW35_06875, partial [Candidatus Sumerlaeota bacterium]|nr:hypothetical protein [Candidatus Sumerlaeota bacterium]